MLPSRKCSSDQMPNNSDAMSRASDEVPPNADALPGHSYADTMSGRCYEMRAGILGNPMSCR